MDDLQLLPLRHPWAHDRTMEMLQNTWLPSQVNTAQDTQAYVQLSHEERFQFQIALANLSTADVQIMDQIGSGWNALLNTFGLTYCPEIRNLQAVMESQEALHNISYMWILESILRLSAEDANAIYGMYKEKPQLGNKVDFCREVDQVAINELYGGPREWSPRGIAAALFRPLIYEGVFFMGGFNPLFWFPHMRKSMLGTAEQLQYIRRDETLHIQVAIQTWNHGIMAKGKLIAEEVDEVCQHLRAFTATALSLEEEFIAYCLGGRGRVGLSIQSHMDHAEALANTRFYQAFGKGYSDKPMSFLPWVDEIAGLRKEKNFFETHVTEYRIGADLWKGVES